MYRFNCFALLWLCIIGLLACVLPPHAGAQSLDPSWLDADRPYLKLSVAEDGVYRLTGDDLRAAGAPIESIDPATLRLFENGREVPLHHRGAGSTLAAADELLFVGKRNRGDDELWAYDHDGSNQSSAYHSLYTDTTYYWLTWGGEDGQRYRLTSGDPEGTAQASVRDTLHREEDQFYYYGDPSVSGSPIFTHGEGYHWINLNQQGSNRSEPMAHTFTLPLERMEASDAPLELTVQLKGGSGSQHRVALEIETAGGSFTSADEVQWHGYGFRQLRAELPQSELPADEVRVRVTSYNDNAANPNRVLVDWIEASYVRSLAAENGVQRFTAEGGALHTFALEGYGSGPVYIFSSTDARLLEREAENGRLRFSDAPSSGTTYWAAAPEGFQSPAAITRAEPADWAASSNRADYVVLTTPALRASAEALADYRREQNGFEVEIVEVQEVYDQFDYGRATPVAIRRFVHQSQSWDLAPHFMVLWADAAFPIRTDFRHEPEAPWNIPAFGFAPSDSWYAMQYDGPNDWSEVLSIGRIPIRADDQGAIMLQKLIDHEGAELEQWQKRVLLLSGGSNESEQRRLKGHSDHWGELGARPPTGADTLHYAKQTDEALDRSFQDSLSVDLERGASWLNYFGHSAAQTWEIVTDEPGNFDNAGRLPFVVSLGCQTGSFAGGRFAEGASYGEKLLLGIDRTGNPTLNGAIGHFGTSYLGSISASARINTALVERVFDDGLRVMGTAIREAKAEIAENFGHNRLYRNHLLQYGLLGDPAMTLNLPTQPDMHLTSAQLHIDPLEPTPSDSLRLAVQLRNQGTVPEDSVDLRVTHERPGGASLTHEWRLAPFRLEETVALSTFLSEEDVGTHHFRAEADPAGQIDEVRTDNNTAERSHAVFASGLALVSPLPRGIVTTREPELRLTLAAASEDDPEVHLQLASDPAFENLLDEARQPATLLTKWTPSSPLTDGETYFWRARLEDEGEHEGWRTGSFTVRTELESEGFYQQGPLFASNTHGDQIEHDGEAWRFEEYEVEVFASSERGFGSFKGRFTLGGDESYENLNLGFGALIVDGTTGEVRDSGSFCTYPVDNDDYRADGCYDVDGEEAIAALETFLEQLEPGDYLFTRTRHLARGGATEIPQRVKDAFRTLGAEASDDYSEAIDTLTYGDLWIMQTRRGYPQETVELVSPAGSEEAEITHRTRLPFAYAEGETTTPHLGPAHEWGQLQWQAELASGEQVEVDILSGDGEEVLLAGAEGPEAPQHLSGISALEHPYLRLRARLADPEHRTAPQLDAWHVTYRATSELAVDRRRLELSADTLLDGEELEVSVPVVNLNRRPTDAIYVRFTVTDADNVTHTVGRDTLRDLAADAEALARASFSTDPFPGANHLSVHAEQPNRPEPIAFNNTAVRSFYVQGDDRAPEVRVLVEGRALPHDPEPLTNLQDPRLPFVSARPTIEIELGQAGGLQRLSDPEQVSVHLDCDPTQGLGCASVPESDTSFVAASSPDEPARVYYEPDLTARDTTHSLRVVVRDEQGRRVRGEDTEVTYQLHFRVQSEMQVRDLYPYPNPMTTHTQFAYRIEGGNVGAIEDFRLRIYTLSGRLIREIDLQAATRHQDWNTVGWDGTDADGHRVATGVYLYRVFLRTADGPIEVNDGRVEKIAVIR